MTIDRRSLIGAAGALALLPWLPAMAAEPRIVPVTVDLAVSPTRSTRLVAWRPARPTGVVLFSTGHGSWPERYTLLINLLTAAGFAVFAPVHVDSMHYPEREKFTMQASFPERLADMKAMSAYARGALPGLPMIAAGHSFGTLIALCLGGALGNIGPFRDPAVKAVLGFSTPGKIPGLIQPTAYASLAVPTLIVTGDKDVVPVFVTDPADHLFPIRSSPPANKFGLVVAGADHQLVAEATPFARAAVPVRDFIAGYGLGLAKSRTALVRYKAKGGDTFIVAESAA